jgi:hypothetical protein
MRNEYEPEHPLQKLYSSLDGRCLCGRGEWCSCCDGTNSTLRKEVVEAAIELDYQLWSKFNGKLYPVEQTSTQDKPTLNHYGETYTIKKSDLL